MRLLVDENIHCDLVMWFRTQGHEVLYAGESLKRWNDSDLLELARTENRFIVTDDLDFGELVYRNRLATQGVILLRLPGMNVSDRIERLTEVWAVVEANLPGRFIVVSPDKLRIRVLPA
jgi:predicted nuclease of predicted toxin-antitoxin system